MRVPFSMAHGSDPFLFIRIIFFCCLIALLFGGGYLFRNYERLFGVSKDVPSDNESAAFYTKTEVFLVWASAVKLFLVAVWFI